MSNKLLNERTDTSAATAGLPRKAWTAPSMTVSSLREITRVTASGDADDNTYGVGAS